MRFKILFFSCTFYISSIVFSQGVTIHTLSGDNNYSMSNVVKFSFIDNRQKIKLIFTDNSEFTYTIDSINCITFSGQISNVNDIITQKIKVFPNPFTTEINIGIDKEFSDDYLVRIIDQNGIVILQKHSKQIDNGKILWDINMMRSSGLYFIEIISRDWEYKKPIIKL